MPESQLKTSISGFELETMIAENLFESLGPALPNFEPHEKAKVAIIVINILSEMTIQNLAKFNNGMVDYITLPLQGKHDVCSLICEKIIEHKIG